MTMRIGIDIGGTKCAAVAVDDAGPVGPVGTAPTPADSFDALVEAVVLLARTVMTDPSATTGIGIGVAGLVDHGTRRVRFAPHLPLLDAPLADRLEDRLGLPVVMDNDATAAAWAEGSAGAGAGSDPCVVVSLGTGIGGGIVSGGRLLRGAHGMAGEFGHLPFVPDGHPCACGARGCWEQYASGNALGRRAREAAGRDPSAASALVARAGGIDAITGHLVGEAATQGDRFAGAVVAEVGRSLGEGLAGLVAAVDPERLVIAGGLSGLGDLLLGPARSALAERVVGGAHRPTVPVVVGRYGAEAAVIGAALLAAEG
jgi:glucokinase